MMVRIVLCRVCARPGRITDAYALALGEGQSPLESARFASATAALKASRGDGWEGMPDRRLVVEVLSRENVE